MGIKIDTTQLGCNGDRIDVAYSEDGNIDIGIVYDDKSVDIMLSLAEARDLAAALYGLVHLA